ncbi:unnamed protein product [Spirodela intermedia]|uniref:Pectinesterase n=1 Tax=Spirodela intermedia TaxID=51605 RepID=A0A7I8J2Z1_SPIIN|nr:unnamed protein product [Spirodela intermedia]CAA6664595.1 unnamed protein product [Spirodela intermedia]
MAPRSVFPASLPPALATIILSSLLLRPAGSSTTLDGWISDTMEEFDRLTAATAAGVSDTLDARLQLAESKRLIITVRQDGTGDFRTVTEAVGSVPEGNGRRTIIKIGPGVYPYVTFYGDPQSMPTIVFNGTAALYGTWNSATVAVESHYFIACHIIFQNSAPMPRMGEENRQAVAMRISGDKAAFYNCKFYGFQDTLCDDTGKHFFKDCSIRGTVDFIFGNGRSIYSGERQQGGVLLHPLQDPWNWKAYLNRAWRDSSRVVFANTYMGSLVTPRAGTTSATVFYGEYNCSGPGSSTADRVGYARVLTEKQVKPFLSPTFIRASTWLLHPPKP